MVRKASLQLPEGTWSGVLIRGGLAGERWSAGWARLGRWKDEPIRNPLVLRGVAHWPMQWSPRLPCLPTFGFSHGALLLKPSPHFSSAAEPGSALTKLRGHARASPMARTPQRHVRLP